MQKVFRSTLWFKKGELDSLAAADAAGEGDDLHPRAVDLLPVEDRYLDDGTVTHDDRKRFSLATGRTQYIRKLAGALPGADAAVTPLVRDLRRGRRAALAVMVASVAAIAAVVGVYVM